MQLINSGSGNIKLDHDCDECHHAAKWHYHTIGGTVFPCEYDVGAAQCGCRQLRQGNAWISYVNLPIDNNDPVNHPIHYTQHPSGVECIQITEHMNFCIGNAVKYLWRADLKNGIEDLEKAAWYVNREIERRKAGKGNID